MKRPDDIDAASWEAATEITKSLPNSYGWAKITADVARLVSAECQKRRHWQPIETAPKDGRWIIGFTGDEDVYVAIRWWDGFMPDDDDDLSCEEKGDWVGADNISTIESITHWIEFEAHPEAPPITTSIGSFDAEWGTECVSRKARGITQNVIDANREFHSRAAADDFDWEDRDKLWDEIAAKYGIKFGCGRTIQIKDDEVSA